MVAQLDAWFAERKAEQARRLADLEATVRAVLACGGTVRETVSCRVSIDWNCATTTFVEDCRNAEYLTRHLMARQGFGYRLEPVFCF